MIEVRVSSQVIYAWHRQLLTGCHRLLSRVAQPDSDVAQAQPINLHIVIVIRKRRFRTGGHRVPALAVLVEVEVFAPLDQVVHFVIEVLIVNILELFVIERIVVE